MKVIVKDNAVREELKRQNLTISELGEITKISYSHLHKVISGRYHTSLNTAVLIAYVLKVDVKKLFKEVKEKKKPTKSII
ncbi:helix-turn-helix transcriptional regulator [Mammaliicoccus sciuri]|uniref:helix-turn-helix domain-containing protein n=1 Tax=Mammaliicoccus sciuri TaxID=1296 RepID=UPI001D0D351B|nr:helix-turn-helix transcriptional regulator [Mammaliicoccus sciuri]MCC2087938.1 helix-turn-helix transcriptional regulator [Mammaliicoccus sciuri]